MPVSKRSPIPFCSPAATGQDTSGCFLSSSAPFSRSLPSEHDYEGFQLLACDGSDLNIFYNPDDKDSCKPSGSGKKGSNQLHLHALYDLCNKKYVDVLIEKTMVSNESRALIQMLRNIPHPDRTIILADRGYETYHVFAHIMAKVSPLSSVQKIFSAKEAFPAAFVFRTGNWMKGWIFYYA